MFRASNQWFFYAGPDYYRDQPFCISFGFGCIENPPINALRFRHIWTLAPCWPFKIWLSFRRRIRKLM